jgi:hypothetical protein
MQRKPHPLDLFIYHSAFCHLAPGAAIAEIVEASMRRDRHEDCEVSGCQNGEDDILFPARHTMGRRLATLRATLRLSLPWVNIRTAYAAIAAKAVTVITFAWRHRTRRAPLDPAVGTLRNTGLFVRPHAHCRHEEMADIGDARLEPAAAVVTDAS